MPRYFFDVHHSGELHQDGEGELHPDHDAAHGEALRIIPELLRNFGMTGAHREVSVHVRTEQGQILYTAMLFMVSLSLGDPLSPTPD